MNEKDLNLELSITDKILGKVYLINEMSYSDFQGIIQALSKEIIKEIRNETFI
jgi:hypothetical protein